MCPISVELDQQRRYHTVDGAGQDSELNVEAILSKAAYPRRLFAGLDDLRMEDLERSLRTSQIITLGLRLTNVCNYDCIYCGTADKRGRDTPYVMTTAEYKDIIDQAADLGARSVIFGANGEPLMTKGLLEIFEHVHARNMVPITFSNISVIGHDKFCEKLHGMSGEEFLRRLDAAGTSLIISVESLRPDAYNHIMGVESHRYFETAVERIRESSMAEPRTWEGRPLCRIAVSCVVMPINYQDRFAMVEFAHSLNGLAILKPPSLHGSAAVNRDQMFTPEEVLKIRPEVAAMSDKQATLQILTLACASWTLSFSIDNEGHFMSCMTEEVNPFGTGMTTRNTRLADVVRRRTELVKLGNTICPVKDKYYQRDIVTHARDSVAVEETAAIIPANRLIRTSAAPDER
jgi:MoaA/NifB/PqqE/SkfB family radical SAM enzyme